MYTAACYVFELLGDAAGPSAHHRRLNPRLERASSLHFSQGGQTERGETCSAPTGRHSGDMEQMRATGQPLPQLNSIPTSTYRVC